MKSCGMLMTLTVQEDTWMMHPWVYRELKMLHNDNVKVTPYNLLRFYLPKCHAHYKMLVFKQ